MSHSDRSVEAETSSTIPEGVVSSSVNRWLLVGANRWFLASLFSVFVFATTFALGWGGVIGVTAEAPATLLLSVFIAGNLTLVSVTITINQLVLSREFGKPHELRKRDDGVKRLRQNVEEVADVRRLSPEPEAFLRKLTETIDEKADTVYEAATATTDPEVADHAEHFRLEITDGTDRVMDALDRSDFGSYELLSAMMEVNSAWLIGRAHYLQHGHSEPMSDTPFEQMEEVLRLFNVTRQYTKTLYAQKEIATLSRLLLYTGFFSVLVSSLGMLVYATSLESILSPTVILVGFSVLSAVAMAPLAFLTSYMLRLSTLMSYPPLRNSFITDG